MRRLDLLFIKPLLIYKYEHGTHKKQKLFNELLMLEGEKLEEIFAKDTINAQGSAGGLRKSQLLDYLQAKSSTHRAGSGMDGSERLDGSKSGVIEMQNQPSSFKKG